MQDIMKIKNYVIFLIFVLLGILIFNKTLSELKPIPKVTFKSQKLDYDKKEPGSFKVDKSAKWIGLNKAKVTIEVDSIVKEKAANKDVVFVMDISGSMHGAKLDQVKKDTTDLVTTVLSNPKSRVALITFDSLSERVSGFTSNKAEFLKKLNSLSPGGATNYQDGFNEAIKLLEGYKKEDDKDLMLLFLTDGFPNINTPNEVALYNELRAKYPYININAIQYEMGKDIKDEIKAISERQFSADMEGLNNVLFQASSNPVVYDNFIITDYISKHFNGAASKIKSSQGEVKLEGDKVTWNLGTYRTGTKATLEIELELIGEKEKFYKTNKGIDINTEYEKEKDNQTSTDTPVLKGHYKVIYEANSPKKCTVKGLEKNTSHRPFEKVELIKGNAKCDGYIFQGYELITEVKYINNDYIEMPEKDVIFRAKWSKIKIDKGMHGEIVKISLANQIISESLGNAKELGIDYSKVNSETNGEGVYLFDETKNDTNPVYFYRGTHNLKNNLVYGGFCWKIVRTTETGGVRIIYNGVPVDGACTNTVNGDSEIGRKPFNSNYDHKKYVGYMYGDDDSPYENINDSLVKKYIDEWYKNNINGKVFETKLDKKAIYCGDRREEKGSGYYIYYYSRNRVLSGKPSLQCPLNDSYSVEDGNKKLVYPIGLLSADEVNLSGATMSKNSNYYLYTGYSYLLNTPSSTFSGATSDGLSIEFGGDIKNNLVMLSSGVRPVLTIASSVLVQSGNGSQNNPYIV